MAEKPYQNEEWLRREYVSKRRTLEQLAGDCNVSAQTIRRWMDKYSIPRRGRSESQINEKKKVHNETWLREQYLGKRRSMKDIAEEVDMTPSGVKKWVDKFGIDTRTATEHYRYTPACYFTDTHGYETHSCRNGRGGQDRVKVHQLVAIANGAEPAKVFSNGRYHIHHKNRIYWDSRAENVELKSPHVHQHDHNARGDARVPSEVRENVDTDELLTELFKQVSSWREAEISGLDVAADEVESLLLSQGD